MHQFPHCRDRECNCVCRSAGIGHITLATRIKRPCRASPPSSLLQEEILRNTPDALDFTFGQRCWHARSIADTSRKQAADKKKAAVLISLLSGTVYSTLKSLCLPQSPGTKTYDGLVALLEDYYKLEVSSVAATYLFNQCQQEHQEPVKDFVNRLK